MHLKEKHKATWEEQKRYQKRKGEGQRKRKIKVKKSLQQGEQQEKSPQEQFKIKDQFGCLLRWRLAPRKAQVMHEFQACFQEEKVTLSFPQLPLSTH